MCELYVLVLRENSLKMHVAPGNRDLLHFWLPPPENSYKRQASWFLLKSTNLLEFFDLEPKACDDPPGNRSGTIP